jgi:hypothetical protein
MDILVHQFPFPPIVATSLTTEDSQLPSIQSASICVVLFFWPKAIVRYFGLEHSLDQVNLYRNGLHPPSLRNSTDTFGPGHSPHENSVMSQFTDRILAKLSLLFAG